MTILVQSFLNSATKLTTAATPSTTVDQLKTIVNGLEGVNTSIMQFYIIDTATTTATVLVSGTLGSYGVSTTATIYSSNTISTSTSKVTRQTAKLDLAELRRKAGGNTTTNYYRSYNVYDINLLADKYTSNTTTVHTTSTLAAHRPWTDAPAWTLPAGMSLHEPLEGSGGTNSTVPGVTYLSAAASGINAAFGTRGTPYNPGGNVSTVPSSAVGLYREKYVGNMWSTYGAFSEFNLAWFSDPTHGPIGVDIYSYAGFGQRQDLTAENGYSLMWRGYVQAPATGTFNWWTSGTDDDAAIWIGTSALTPTYANMNGYASNNRVLSLNSVNLTAGQWYPVRMVFTEFNGWEQCQWFLQDSTHGVLYNGTDLTWAYNNSTNGY